MRLKTIGAVSVAAAMAFGLSSVQAQKAATDCGVQPPMPEIPAEFDSEDHAGVVVGEIKSYQEALKSYRECLVLVEENELLDIGVRQDALDAFNQSTDNEGAVVNRYMEAVKKWKEANPE